MDLLRLKGAMRRTTKVIMSTFILEIKRSSAILEVENETWCASHPGLGLVVYGDTAEQAINKLDEAIGFLFDLLLVGGEKAVRARFDKAADTEYSLTIIEDAKPQRFNIGGTFARMPGPPPRLAATV